MRCVDLVLYIAGQVCPGDGAGQVDLNLAGRQRSGDIRGGYFQISRVDLVRCDAFRLDSAAVDVYRSAFVLKGKAVNCLGQLGVFSVQALDFKFDFLSTFGDE